MYSTKEDLFTAMVDAVSAKLQNTSVELLKQILTDTGRGEENLAGLDHEDMFVEILEDINYDLAVNLGIPVGE